MNLVEKEQDHSHAKENFFLKNQIAQNWAGLIIGALLVAGFFIGAYNLAMAGHDAVAGIIVSGTIISIATIFVLHKLSGNNSKEETGE